MDKTPNCNRLGQTYELYAPPITLNLPEWNNYVASGDNTLYGDSIIPGDTEMNGAVYSGHVRQNPMTAMYPYDSIQKSY